MTVRIHPLWVALLVLTASVGGAAAGVAVTREAASSPSPSSVLSLSAAGTLRQPFGELAAWVANATPGVQAPPAAQQYEGSLAALNAIAQLGGRYDVAGSADYRLIPTLLEPRWASWEIVFATTPIVLAYNPAAFPGLNASNWIDRIEASGVHLGIANASIDPIGYDAIFVLELAGLVDRGSLDSVYGHFFTTPPGAYAVPDPATTRVVPETQAAVDVATNLTPAFLIYQSYALSHHLAFLPLDPAIDLGASNATALASYARARTLLLAPQGGTTAITGAPVLFAATVPGNAPNATLGEVFLEGLLSPVGQRILSELGFAPIFPAYADRPGALPSIVAPWVVGLPPMLASPAGGSG